MRPPVGTFRAVLPVVILVGLIVGWYQLWYQPISRKIVSLGDASSQAEHRLQRYCRHLQTAHEVTSEYHSLNEQWARFQQSLTDPAKAEQVQQDLSGHAERYRLTMLDFGLDLKPLLEKINDPKWAENVSTVRITMEGRGTFSDIGEFLASLSDRPSISAVHTATLQYEQPAYPEVYFSVQLDVLMAGNRQEQMP